MPSFSEARVALTEAVRLNHGRTPKEILELVPFEFHIFDLAGLLSDMIAESKLLSLDYVSLSTDMMPHTILFPVDTVFDMTKVRKG